MKVRTRITVAFLLIAILGGAAGYINLVNAGRIGNSFDVLHNEILPTTDALKDAKTAVLSISDSTNDFASVRDETLQAVHGHLIEQGKSNLNAAIDKYEHLVTTYFLHEKNFLNDIKAKQNQFGAASDRIADIENNKGSAADMLGAQQAFTESRDELLDAINASLAFEQDKAKEAQETLASSLNNTFYETVAILIATISVSLVIGMSILHSVSKPLEKLRGAARAISKGNFDVETDLERKDEFGELAADFDKMKQELKEKDRLKEEFINLAAHELRTPVQPIILTAEELVDGINDEENKSKIERIVRNARHLNKLTKDILDVSRLESNTLKLQKEKTDIKKLILDSVQDATLKIPDSQNVKILCEFALPEEKKEITIDKERISEVLVNLLDNAINFTDSGKITVRVEETKQPPKFLQVKVIDTGRGIDESIKDKLFQKFVTKSEKAKGTGLGLYLCKGIVESHGGEMRAENNKDGKGATFTFTLPIIG